MTRKNTEPIGTTPRLFVSAVTFIGLLFAFLFWTLTSTHAAPKWKQEVGIGSWCYSVEVLKEIVKAENDGNPELGNALAAQALNDRECVRLPVPAAAFRPKAEVQKYEDFGGQPVTILKGNLIQKDESIGREVYVLVPDKLLQTFQMTEGAVAPLRGPEFAGWQDL